MNSGRSGAVCPLLVKCCAGEGGDVAHGHEGVLALAAADQRDWPVGQRRLDDDYGDELLHADVGLITVQAMPLARSRGIGWWKGAERRDEQEPAHPRGLGCLDQVQVSGLVD